MFWKKCGTYQLLQKAVVNAIVSSGINNNPDGMHVMYMNNHNSAPELFVLLCEK